MGAVAILILVNLQTNIALAEQWSHHVNNMMMHRSKLRALEGELQQLIADKKHSEDPERVKELTTLMRTKYTELETSAAEFRVEAMHMRFKHPERGDDHERQYARFKLKTLKEYESSLGLDGQLDRLKIKVSQVYQTKKPEKKILAEQKKLPTAQRVPASTGEERIRLER